METGQIGLLSLSALNRFAAQDTKPSIALAQIRLQHSTDPIVKAMQHVEKLLRKAVPRGFRKRK